MAAYFFNSDTRDLYFDKINSIKPSDTPQWGKLHPTQMLRHLRYTFEASIGETTMPDQSNLITRNILKPLFFEWLTNWPKGKIKAPDFFTPEPDGDFDFEKQLLFEKGDLFLEKLKTSPNEKHISALLGPTPISYWSRVHGVHIRHHLIQYNVW